MKKILLTLLVFATFGISNLSAQEHAVKANPFGLAFGLANAGYEFSVNEKQSIYVSGLYYNVSDISGFGLGAEYRFYFKGDALRGWHAGPSLGFVSLGDDSDNTANVLSLGGEIGHQWIIANHFLIDLFGGVGYVVGGTEDLSETVNQTAISLGVSIGYAW